MKKFTSIRNGLLATALLGSSLMLQAQTATWNGLGGDGLWNTAANWNPAAVPGVGGSAIVSSAVTVSYSAPMSAASISNLLLSGSSVLNLSAAGFNVDSGNTAKNVTVGYSGSGGTLNINSGGELTLTNAGQLMISTNGLVTVGTGGTLLTTNTLNGSDAILVGDNKRLASATSRGRLQILGGTATVDKRVTIAGSTTTTSAGQGSEVFIDSGVLNLLGGGQINNTSDDGACRFLVNGGTVNMANFIVARSIPNPSAGLIISNGVVTASGIQIGTSASRAYAAVYGGVLTNTGTFNISDTATAANSGDRRSRFFILGGTVVSTGINGIIVGNQQNGSAASSSVFGGVLDVSGGTLTANGITLVKDNSIANAYGTLNLSSAGTIYLGALGLVGNPGAGGSGYFVTLSGGTLGAIADYTNNANATVSGPLTVRAADAAGNPFNIYASGIWSGGGSLTKTGNGTLTLDAADTYTGNTAINAGKLVLGASGSINNSAQINVASGASFDVSAVSGYTVPASKTLTGMGAVIGDVAMASTANLKPGSNALTGTLTFSNNLTMAGGVQNYFDLSTDPNGPNNDLVVVGGDLNVSGSNPLEITSGGPANSVHPLFKYNGTFTGDLSSFVLSGTAGYLTNDTSVSPKMIAFIVSVTIRGATNVVWVGNDANNVWDVLNTTNWLNGANLDYYVSADNVLFNGVGQANSNVVINVAVAPSATTVDSAGDYSFSGSGAIGGLGGLTKTNSGTLTISTINNYSGPTTINGGKISVATLANGGLTSTLGASTADAANLVLNNGTLEYTGVNKSIDRGATLQSGGGTLSVTDPTATLTVSGTVTGSGTLTKIGNGQLNLSAPNNFSGGTVINAGTVRPSQSSSITLTALGTNIVTFNGGETNAATLQFSADAQLLANTINVVGTNNFVSIAGNDTLENITGNGTLYLNAQSGTVLTIEGNMSTFSGTLWAGTVPNLRMHPSTGSASAVFNLGTGSCLFNNRNGNLTVQVGALIGGPSTVIQGASSANNPTTYVIGALNQPTLFEGNITEVASGRKVNIVKVGTSSLTLSGAALPYSGNTTISNGVLALSGSSTIPNSAIVTVGAGAFFDVSALGTPTFTVNTAQTLTGAGTVNGSVDGTGTISPGNGIGTLTITNIATLGGTLYVELNRTHGVQTNDILAASSIVLGGTLTVTNLGPNLVAGDRFYLFNGPISGAFGTVNLPENLGNVTYTWTNKTDIDGSIEVLTVTTVNQTPTNLVTSVTGNTLTLSWPSDHIGWRLQSQTNDLSTGLGSTWTDVDGSASTNSVDITLDPANGAVFYRMVFP